MVVVAAVVAVVVHGGTHVASPFILILIVPSRGDAHHQSHTGFRVVIVSVG